MIRFWSVISLDRAGELFPVRACFWHHRSSSFCFRFIFSLTFSNSSNSMFSANWWKRCFFCVLLWSILFFLVFPQCLDFPSTTFVIRGLRWDRLVYRIYHSCRFFDSFAICLQNGDVHLKGKARCAIDLCLRFYYTFLLFLSFGNVLITASPKKWCFLIFWKRFLLQHSDAMIFWEDKIVSFVIAWGVFLLCDSLALAETKCTIGLLLPKSISSGHWEDCFPSMLYLSLENDLSLIFESLSQNVIIFVIFHRNRRPCWPCDYCLFMQWCQGNIGEERWGPILIEWIDDWACDMFWGRGWTCDLESIRVNRSIKLRILCLCCHSRDSLTEHPWIKFIILMKYPLFLLFREV